MSLPQAYRRYVASAGTDGAGTDVYTRRTGDLCVRSPEVESDLQALRPNPPVTRQYSSPCG
jgi:hypothetical protein